MSRSGLARGALALWVAAVLLSAPYLPRLRDFLNENRRGGLSLYLGAALLVLAGGALALALARSSGRRAGVALRLGLLAATGAAGYALLAAPDPRARFIEAAHFAEYGLLAVLAYRTAGETVSPPGRALRSFAAALAVGLVDESIQWILPSRTAEIRDVALNALAGGLGTGYAWMVIGPSPALERMATEALMRSERREWALTGILLILALGLFVQGVHRGQLILWEGLAFTSMFTAEGLDRIAVERRARWASLDDEERRALLKPQRKIWGIEDFYATEALRHIQTRNEAAERGEAAAAAAENRLLERFYQPFLQAASARRNDLGGTMERTYRSPALGHLWPWLTPTRLWGALLLGVGGLLLTAFGFGGAR